MKYKLFLSAIFIIVLASCTSQPLADDPLKSKELIALQIENDSLKKVLSQKEKEETLKAVPAVQKTNKSSRKAGKHPITLQWIGWDKPGEVIIKPLNDEWYSIGGSQKNSGSNILTIEGKIRRLSEKELEFIGTITTKVSSIYAGEPCIKTGKQMFYAKGNRQYFRLQNMTNCEGGMLVDYIDIYKGTSSL